MEQADCPTHRMTSYAEMSDPELIAAFVAGNAKAFDEIVHRYRPLCYGIALNWLRNHEDAQEVANDVMIRAHRGLARFRHECSLRTWLHGITVRTAVNRHHYWRRRRRGLTDSLDMPVGSFDGAPTIEESLASPEPTVVESIEIEELGAEVARALLQLRPKHRDILTLRMVQHRTYEEISIVLGMRGVGTVKSRIARARENLRAALPAEMLA